MMIQTTDIQLFQILKQRLGETEAEALVYFVDSKIRENNEANLKTLATKEEIAKLDGKLGSMIAETKTDMIKWMSILDWFNTSNFKWDVCLLKSFS